MKRFLLLIPALAAALFVQGAEEQTAASQTDSLSNAVRAQATIQESKPADKSAMSYILSDSALYHGSLEILKRGSDSLSYVSIQPPKEEAKVDTVEVVKKEAPAKPKGPVRPFRKVRIYGGGRDRWGNYTEECAAHANGRLSRYGIFSTGHAYQIPARFSPIINGYMAVTLPEIRKMGWQAQFNAVMDAHRQAADYVKEHLDFEQLIPGKYYVVNMYYNTSKYMISFFLSALKQGTMNYATHVGVLYFDERTQTWVVEHNIHGTVYRDSLRSVLGGASNPHKFGVTTIYLASKSK